VNPTQFGDPKDLEAYPRTLEADRAMLEAEGVDALFLPSVAEMYPQGDETAVETTRLSALFHGAVRPGHFRGVATVVTKLLNIVRPDFVTFGEKDYQQLAVIRRMVRDLHVPVEVLAVPTLREPDGLALSSRNARLTPGDRAAAAVLHRALRRGAGLARNGQTLASMEHGIRAEIAEEPRAQDAQVHIVDAETFDDPGDLPRRSVGIMVSARFGDVLLIDQMEVAP
jgi:pantoate--beta-alanine ligase